MRRTNRRRRCRSMSRRGPCSIAMSTSPFHASGGHFQGIHDQVARWWSAIEYPTISRVARSSQVARYRNFPSSADRGSRFADLGHGAESAAREFNSVAVSVRWERTASCAGRSVGEELGARRYGASSAAGGGACGPAGLWVARVGPAARRAPVTKAKARVSGRHVLRSIDHHGDYASRPGRLGSWARPAPPAPRPPVRRQPSPSFPVPGPADPRCHSALRPGSTVGSASRTRCPAQPRAGRRQGQRPQEAPSAGTGSVNWSNSMTATLVTRDQFSSPCGSARSP